MKDGEIYADILNSIEVIPPSLYPKLVKHLVSALGWEPPDTYTLEGPCIIEVIEGVGVCTFLGGYDKGVYYIWGTAEHNRDILRVFPLFIPEIK